MHIVQVVQGAWQFSVAHKAEIFGGLFGLSELLALIPWVKANAVFQLIFPWLKKEAGK